MAARILFLLFSAIGPLPCLIADAQTTSPDRRRDVARTIIGDAVSAEEKVRRLVNWMQSSFTWSVTDYQTRGVDEIIERRAGNCAELTIVLAALLDDVGLQWRWVAELNLQPESLRRQAAAVEQVQRSGKSASVFGLAHNDHRWLEVRDPISGEWFPADPAAGVVGLRQWVRSRLAFGKRDISPVPAIASIMRDMLVPLAVVARPSRRSGIIEDRSKHYVINAFDEAYDQKLRTLSSWPEWNRTIGEVAVLARLAFEGQVNLHEHAVALTHASVVYDKLQGEYALLEAQAVQ
ncbi:MAG TPA: transglutaminase-like domain-containing protein [Thermoanaerobaculia bacterium]|nr:transglutaminase-like domain-containing protein [Thermoanaerobaculia bacterium]